MENDPADLFHVWSASFLMEEETDQIRQEEYPARGILQLHAYLKFSTTLTILPTPLI
jgi:hypothetical protein